MKKLLLTAIVAFAFCGSLFAQTSHWADYDDHAYQFNAPLVAFVQVNDAFIEATDDWANVEIAAFVDGVCRGHAFMADYTDDGDPHPVLELTIDYTTSGEAVTFKMFRHDSQTLIEDCTSNIEILTGDAHDELYFEYDDAVILSFVASETPSLTLEIEPYTGTTDHYYLIASPFGAVTAENVEGLMTPEYDFYSFDQEEDGEGNEWILHKDAEFELQRGMGYLYANNTGTDLTFTGTPIEGESLTLDLVYIEGKDWTGWNLLGNPYEVSVYPDRPFCTMNPNGDNYISNDAYAELPAMYGAFFKADNPGETVTFYKTQPSKTSRLNLNLSNSQGVVDRAIVRFDEGNTLTKIQFRESNTKVYIPMDNKDYAVVNAEEMGEMPVSFKAEKNGSYSLSFTAEEVSFNYLHLIDNMTGADVDLLVNPSYSFDALTTDYANRFKLVFATGNATDDNFAFFSNGNFIISNEGEATLQVVDVMGRILMSENINGSASVNVNAATGVYMLRLINGDNVKVQKVIVK